MTADCIDNCCALTSICNARLALVTCKVEPAMRPEILTSCPFTAKFGAKLPTFKPPTRTSPLGSFSTKPLTTINREFVDVALVAKISPFNNLKPCTRTL